MKKLLTFIVTTAMLLSLAVIGVSADATYSDTKPSGLGEEIFDKGAALEDITEQSGSNIHNLASGGSSFCVKADSWVRYEFDLDVAKSAALIVGFQLIKVLVLWQELCKVLISAEGVKI